MSLKVNEIEWLAERLKEHLTANLCLSSEDIEFYFNKLPSCHYKGIAFRVMKNDSSLKEEVKFNRCWSKTKSGCEALIKNYYQQNLVSDFSWYQAEVKGLDVNKLIKYLQNQEFELPGGFKEEEEIIVLEYSEFKAL